MSSDYRRGPIPHMVEERERERERRESGWGRHLRYIRQGLLLRAKRVQAQAKKREAAQLPAIAGTRHTVAVGLAWDVMSKPISRRAATPLF